MVTEDGARADPHQTTGDTMPSTTIPDPVRRDGHATEPVHLEPPFVSTDVRTSSDDAAVPASNVAPVVRLDDVSFYYGAFRAVKGVTINVPTNQITALIGPSGCGKSTLLRTINRMNDLIPNTRVEGSSATTTRTCTRRTSTRSRCGGVSGWCSRRRTRSRSRSTTTWPSAPGLTGYKGNLDELVESSLRRAALWEEVKDKLRQSGLSLSGGQQQRLCIARAIATQPEVILMDEPCSALDPRATLQIEELMAQLKENYTIIIVTHNMQQAARASDRTVFMNMADDRAGYVVEQDQTVTIFTNPSNQMTEDYVSGRFG